LVLKEDVKMSENLKPCLRCGDTYSHFERWVDTDEGVVLYRVVCGACEFMPDHWEEEPAKAAEYWNYRPVEDALRAEIAGLADERNAAIAECRRRKGWDQDIVHWRERAEKAESELQQAQEALRDILYFRKQPWLNVMDKIE
jgi:hypothetical protein